MCKHGWQLQNYVISEMQTETVNQTLPSESLSNKTSKGITDIHRQHHTADAQISIATCFMHGATIIIHYHYISLFIVIIDIIIHCHYISLFIIIIHYHYSLSLFIIIIYHYPLFMIIYSWFVIIIIKVLCFSARIPLVKPLQVTGHCERPWGTTRMAALRCWIIRNPMRSSGRSSLDDAVLLLFCFFLGRYLIDNEKKHVFFWDVIRWSIMECLIFLIVPIFEKRWRQKRTMAAMENAALVGLPKPGDLFHPGTWVSCAARWGRPWKTWILSQLGHCRWVLFVMKWLLLWRSLLLLLDIIIYHHFCCYSFTSFKVNIFSLLWTVLAVFVSSLLLFWLLLSLTYCVA